MQLKKSSIHKILVFTLSNIGDVVLTFPVIDILRRDFPEAQLDVIVSPKASELFDQNPHIQNVIIYDKRQSKRKTCSWIRRLFQERYSLVVDLKNSALPLFIGAKHRTSYLVSSRENDHMKHKHLRHLKSIYDYESESEQRYALVPQDYQVPEKPYCVMAPGSANSRKIWASEKFAQVADQLHTKHGMTTVFVGDQNDNHVTEKIFSSMTGQNMNLCGQTALGQTAALVHRSLFVLANDSAVMHMASYLDKPVLALFGGASFPQRYGPWSSQSKFLFQENIRDIDVEDVMASLCIQNKDVTFV